jgi:RimJ/RimL family protein N-acetyltransferase
VIRLLLRYLFDTSPAHVVTAGYASWNDEARALFDELGFHHSGAMRCTGFRAGRAYDWVVVDLLRAEWESKEADHAAGR